MKITMSVTLAPELTEAIKESAERHGLSFDDWIVAAAELKQARLAKTLRAVEVVPITC
ncbi:MAG: hypothetical protein ACRDP7_19500 [Trebonia sp.]